MWHTLIECPQTNLFQCISQGFWFEGGRVSPNLTRLALCLLVDEVYSSPAPLLLLVSLSNQPLRALPVSSVWLHVRWVSTLLPRLTPYLVVFVNYFVASRVEGPPTPVSPRTGSDGARSAPSPRSLHVSEQFHSPVCPAQTARPCALVVQLGLCAC